MSNLMTPQQPMQSSFQPVKLSEKQTNQIIGKCNNLFSQMATSRASMFEQQWYMNMSFFFGRQYVVWRGTNTNSPGLFSLWEPPAPRWRVRLVANKVRRAVRGELAKKTKEKVRYFVVPETSTDEDAASSRAAMRISEYLFAELKWETLRRRATFWSLLTGTSFLKTFYSEMELDSSGIPGRVGLETVNSFHMYVPDYQSEDIEAQPYVCHAQAKSPEWVHNTYGKDVSADVKVGGSLLEQKFFGALGLTAMNSQDYIYVKEMWYKPCRDYPEGAVIIWAGDNLLSFTNYWPYNFGTYPFSKIEAVPSGRFFTDSIITDLIPLQKEYNLTRSQLSEARNRMARPQLLAPAGSIDASKLTSEPGLVIPYKPGFTKPEPLQLMDIPQYVINELDRTQRDMDDISGQYEVSKGRTPPGVDSATAVAYLQEENDSIYAPEIATIEEACEKVGKQLLVMVNQFWDIPRKIKVAGENETFETMMFSNADVRGNTDFRVESGSSLPQSRSAKQAFIMEMMDKGYIPPQKGLRYLDLNETNRLYDEMQTSVRQVQRENIMMKNGTPAVINWFDNVPDHIDGHQTYMRSQEFENQPDEIKQIFLQHLQQHVQQFQTQGSVDQQMMGMIPQPGMPQPGPPPGQMPLPGMGQQPE